MWVFLAAAALAAPDVFFMTVDTLRADHLGCYGYPLPTSPSIDALSGQSLVFDDAVCEVPLTMPSFASMLTSEYPRVTGTTRNGLRLPAEIPTVAELFKSAGYATFCVQSNWTLKSKLSGLDRGFDVYDDGFRKRRWGLIKSERDADEVTRIALDLIEKREPGKPLFGWIHFSDPHAPYKYHRRFDPRRAEDGGQHRDWNSDPRRKRVTKNYDSEIRFTDYHMGEILKAIPADAIVVFLSDHGESLYEHGYLGHGRRIYQNGMRIPLMIRGPGIAPGRSPAPVRGIDVGPTLLALAGLAAPDAMEGLNVLSEIPSSRARVIETYGGAVPQIWGAKSLMADKPPQLQGVLLSGWKLILNGSTSPELYHLVDDPMEQHSLAAMEPARVAELEKLVREWDATTTRAKPDEANLTSEDRRALDNLGYME